MTIHAITVRQIGRDAQRLSGFLSNFVKGHFYMTTEYSESFVETHYKGMPPPASYRAVKNLVEAFPEHFKLVYESRPFLNTIHPSEHTPYLQLFIVEKL